MKFASYILGLLAFTLLISGCAQIQAQSRVDEYNRMLTPMLRVAPQYDIVPKFGMPSRTAQLGNYEVWEYTQSFGVRGGANAYTPNPYNRYGVSTYAYGQSHEVYDKVTLAFDRKRVLQDWQVLVQR